MSRTDARHALARRHRRALRRDDPISLTDAVGYMARGFDMNAVEGCPFSFDTEEASE